MPANEEPTKRDVTIIVPIHNARAAVDDCLRALRDSAPHVPTLLIDDASTDPLLAELLDTYSTQHTNITLIRAKRNRGFIGSVNLGLRATAGADCIILNSDTRASGSWVHLLTAAADTDPSAGILFPTSNNSSIYSIPQLAAIDASLGGETVARALADAFPDSRLAVPTAAGFCMYVKRELLDSVGLLDTIFDKGYGEENDLCQRARQAGYTIQWVLGAYVFHEGGSSMVPAGVRGSDTETIPAHEEILRARYPRYSAEAGDADFRSRVEQVQRIVLDGCIQKILRRFPPAAHLLHTEPREDALGGVERHVRELLAVSAANAPVVALFPRGAVLQLQVRVGTLVLDYLTAIPSEQFGASGNGVSANQAAILLARLLHVERAHFHHVIGFAYDLPEKLQQAGVRTIFTVHDYFLANPDPTLLTGLSASAGETQHYSGYFGSTFWSMTDWHRRSIRFLQHIDLVVCPSHAALAVLQDSLGWAPAPSTATLVRPHPESVHACERARLVDDQGRHSVLFLGSTHRSEKGAQIVNELVPKLLVERLEVHFLGSRADQFADRSWTEDRHVTFHGRYHQRNAVQQIRAIDPTLGILVSPWPETFSYTLSELRSAAVPAIVGPSGAPAERVHEAGDGIVAESYSADAVMKAVRMALDPQRLGHLRQNAEATAAGCESVSDYLDCVNATLPPAAAPGRPPAGWDDIPLRLLIAGTPPSSRTLKDTLWPFIPKKALPTLVRIKRIIRDALVGHR